MAVDSFHDRSSTVVVDLLESEFERAPLDFAEEGRIDIMA